tara:strand:- start:8879 stop:9277 length:399 start_codon:yes stop_codon:yes gene_type:complete
MGDYALVLTLILLVVLSSGCTTNTYSTWTEEEQTRYKYFLGLQAVDTIQTYNGLKCTSDKLLTECIEELNPVYGKNPSLERIVGTKLLANLLIYAALTNDSDSFDRELNLNIMNAGYTLVIINNQIVINRAF